MVGPAEPANLRQYLYNGQNIPQGMGGVPTSNVVSHLLERGNEICLITASTHVSSTVILRGPRLEVRVVPYRQSLVRRMLDVFGKEVRALRRAASGWDYDVAHVQWTYEFAYALRGFPRLVITIHDAPATILRYMPTPYRFLRWLMAVRVSKFDALFTAVSPYVAARWRIETLSRELPIITPNIIRTEWVDYRHASGAPHSIVSVGSASRLKNIRRLLCAFHNILAEYPDASLTVIGPGLSVTDPIAHWARRKGLGSNVRYSGALSHDETVERMRESKVLAHPSLEESFGMTLVEGAVAGCVIVAGKSSGATSWLCHVLGADCLVDVRSVKELSVGLRLALGGVASRANKQMYLRLQKSAGEALDDVYRAARTRAE